MTEEDEFRTEVEALHSRRLSVGEFKREAERIAFRYRKLVGACTCSHSEDEHHSWPDVCDPTSVVLAGCRRCGCLRFARRVGAPPATLPAEAAAVKWAATLYLDVLEAVLEGDDAYEHERARVGGIAARTLRRREPDLDDAELERVMLRFVDADPVKIEDDPLVWLIQQLLALAAEGDQD